MPKTTEPATGRPVQELRKVNDRSGRGVITLSVHEDGFLPGSNVKVVKEKVRKGKVTYTLTATKAQG